MAGLGSRFSKAGFKKPKPFIDVLGLTMIERVLENIKYKNAKFYLISNAKHINEEKELVEEISHKYNATFIPIEILTEGTACTVLYARKFINNEAPLLIANSDQIVDIDIKNYIDDCKERFLDGSILCFKEPSMDPKWSYAKINEDNIVIDVKEKVPISDLATVGIYYFSRGKYFVDGAVDMIINNDRVNNEFYTCPVYNYCIKDFKKIGVYIIEKNKMHGTGTPADLERYKEILVKDSN